MLSIIKEVVKIEFSHKTSNIFGKSFEKIIKTILNKNGKTIISELEKVELLLKSSCNFFINWDSIIFLVKASHGDMGQIIPNDAVILISLSGQSDELKKYN